MNDNELAGLGVLAGFGTFFFIIIVVCLAIAIVPYWFITKRLGWHPAWSLIILLPLGALVWPYYVAFSKWPIDNNRPGGPPAQGGGGL